MRWRQASLDRQGGDGRIQIPQGQVTYREDTDQDYGGRHAAHDKADDAEALAVSRDPPVH